MAGILIVDDEPDLREILMDDFQEVGFEVKGASGGDQAFDMVQSFKPDAIVTDIRMPKGSGIELLDRIKQSDHKEIEVFLITGFADISEKEALEKGAKAVFKKPFDFMELVRDVKAVVESK